MIDLAPTHLKTVRRLLAAHVPECEVCAFGSRVAWTAKGHSDLDLAVKGASKLPPARLRQLREAFEESTLPIRVDLLDWHSISENFRSVIQKQYVVLQQPKAVTVSPAAVSLKKNWRHVALSEVMDVKHGFAFPGENIRDKPPGEILVTPGNFAIGGGFKGDKFKYFDGAIPEDYVLREGDLIVTMTDLSKQADTLGFPALVPKPTGACFLHNQRIGKVLIKRNAELDKRFLFYLLRTAAYRDEVLASATGTTVKHTSPGRILAFKADIPPLPEQKAIAHILGTLDNKIELNRKMNATLEAMARALFQSWFVDFDPVRRNLDRAANPAAKRKVPSLGKTPAANFQSLELDALFPAAFQESGVGHIPRGWRVGTIQDCCTQIQNGGTPRRNEPRYWDGGTIPWLASGEVRQPVITATESFITNAGLAESSAKWVSANSTVIALYGATAGQVSFISSKLTTNQAVCALIPKKDFEFFNYLTMRAATTELENKAVGSAQQNISKGIVEETKVVLPPVSVIEKFSGLVRPLFGQWIANLHQSHTLAMLRDTLLPKLLSGSVTGEIARMRESE